MHVQVQVQVHEQGRDSKHDETAENSNISLERHEIAGGGTGSSDTPRADQPVGGEGREGLQADQHQQRHQSEQQRARGGEAGADVADAAGAATAGHDGESSEQQGGRHADKTFHRYYHLYRKGELEEEVVSAGGKVVNSGYERDNWWVIAG